MRALRARACARCSRGTARRGTSSRSARAPSSASRRVRARTGAEAHDAIDPLLDDLVHAALLNRGVMLTPFHNMALMGPATTIADVEQVLAALDAVVGEIFER